MEVLPGEPSLGGETQVRPPLGGPVQLAVAGR